MFDHRVELLQGTPQFEDLSETPPDECVPELDRAVVDESRLTRVQRDWRKNGFVILKNFMPDDLMDRYIEVRAQWPNVGGWSCPVPYMHVPEIKDLCLYPPLMDTMQSLLGEEMMMHLNLTSWVSSEREWHQDDYLNPGYVNSYYAACWFALDTIHPDSGPFEFVPGTHKWPLLRQDRIRAHLARISPVHASKEGGAGDGKGGHWASYSESFVKSCIEAKLARNRMRSQFFLGRKGDVLIWHGRLIHRGSKPRQPGMLRKMIIAHYSAVSKRADMAGQARYHTNGKCFAEHLIPLYASSTKPAGGLPKTDAG